KVVEGGKGPNVLDEGGQGVLHFAAALGYHWAIPPTTAAGVSVNFGMQMDGQPFTGQRTTEGTSYPINFNMLYGVLLLVQYFFSWVWGCRGIVKL
ncbi:UNVERIFIED_CONTAM: Calmodulin-binding transcription activator 3, partial [Sesamum latifolium]